MENDWATQQIQVIRTLMERSALYRRALAPIMTYAGTVGILAGVAGNRFAVVGLRAFIVYWLVIGIISATGAFLLVRRQALNAAESFWSLPTRRVFQALFPAYLTGLMVSLLMLAFPGLVLADTFTLPILWMLLYGCGLHSAGAFMVRGFRLFAWLFLISACVLLAVRGLADNSTLSLNGHLVMGSVFGGLHLFYGIYLYFTEQDRIPA